MNRTTGLRQVTRTVSDGTGRSHEEVWMLVAATATVAASVAAVRGLIWAVDLATGQELWPTPPERARR
jgi:hypothetical protein